MLLEGASAFATMVGLLSAFNGGRQSDKSADLTEFISWLMEHNHNELVKAIEQNQSTSISIKALLNQNASDLNGKLDYLGETLGQLAKRISCFDQLSESLLPNVGISDQAFSILEQMSDLEIEFILVLITYDGLSLHGSNNKQVEYTEKLFLKDDLTTLTNLGLLKHDYTESGKNKYYYTRMASRLIAESRK